jgi:hypothetical protein
MYGQYQGGGRPEPEASNAQDGKWPLANYEIGRLLFREIDFVGNVIIPSLAGNISRVTSRIDGATPVCHLTLASPANHQAMAASLGVTREKRLDIVFAAGVVCRVVFSVRTRRPQRDSDRFAALLADMPGQQGIEMGDFYKR